MKKSVLVAPPFLKQKARQLKKEKSLKQREALDQASILFGFTNYQNYLNALEISRPKPRVATAEDMDKIWAEKQIIAMGKFAEVKLLIQKIDLPIADWIKVSTKLLSPEERQKFFDEKSNIKRYLELTFLKDFLEDEDNNVDDFAPYHVAKAVSLKDLQYEIDGEFLKVEGSYDLLLEFAFDYDKDDHDEFFKDEKMFGCFDLTIGAQKTIVVEDMDIGHIW